MFKKSFSWSKVRSTLNQPVKIKVSSADRKSAHRKGNGKNQEADPDQCFWVNNGPVLKNLAELQQALETMSDEQYAYHVQEHGNDFANWIEGSLGDKALAKRFAHYKSRRSAARALKNYLA